MVDVQNALKGIESQLNYLQTIQNHYEASRKEFINTSATEAAYYCGCMRGIGLGIAELCKVVEDLGGKLDIKEELRYEVRTDV